MSLDEIKHQLDAIQAAWKPDEKSARAFSFNRAIRGREIKRKGGTFYLVERSLDEVWKNSNEFVESFIETLSRSVPEEHHHPELRQFLRADPERILYLDIETGGLAGSPVFLVGMMHQEARDIRIMQLLARDDAEEGPMLRWLAAMMKDFDLLVTYNGKTFDVPQLAERSAVNGVTFHPPKRHFDLLHESRRRWKSALPDCRLQTLEARLCGRRRIGDIPSRLIPRAFENFAASGDPAQVKEILDHNLLDLVTMAQLLLGIFATMA